jgi:uncharacterized protein YndB with AHSA1/START domain
VVAEGYGKPSTTWRHALTTKGTTLSEHHETGIHGSLHSDDGAAVVHLTAHYDSAVDDVWSALSEPVRLARWFANVSGDLQTGGDFTAYVLVSAWDGHGRINTCVPQETLSVTLWEVEGVEHVVSAQLTAIETRTTLAIVVRGVPMEFLWAYGAGWHAHLDDLGAHLSGRDRAETLDGAGAHFEEFEAIYREMPVTPLER